MNTVSSTTVGETVKQVWTSPVLSVIEAKELAACPTVVPTRVPTEI